MENRALDGLCTVKMDRIVQISGKVGADNHLFKGHAFCIDDVTSHLFPRPS